MAADDRKTPKLPVKGKRNILITSALPYVNNVPHLGNIIGCVLSADVYARYCRLRGYNAIYICGTDEYGTATETKAMEENCSPKEICDKYHAIHKEIYEWFDISFDKFGRTSAPQQTELYCDTCKRFLADRLVEGICPTPGCEYDSARGDQCEKCGKLLNPTELKTPRCKVCQNTPRIRDTEHLFLELPQLREKLEKYIEEVKGSWSSNAKQTTASWLKEGLKPRCITRDLKWGVPVPHEKYSDKVFYVWFDAPIGYVSITACYTPEWEKWWKNPEDVELYQFMGKDNVPFHTVMFPSTLLGTGENWTLMKTISVTEYLNYEAGKFSKSKGIGVSDTLFTWPDLQAKLNSELLNNLGNFINRVLSFIAKPEGQGYDSTVPALADDLSSDSHDPTKKLAERISAYIDQYIEEMEKVRLKQGLKIAMAISTEGNGYLQECEFWRLYKENKPLCSLVMKTAVGVVYILACLLEPFIPSFTQEVFKQLNLSTELHLSLCDEKGDINKAKRPWEIINAGHKIGKPQPLFKELKDEDVESYRKKFAGSQADRILRAEAEAGKVAEELKKTKLSDGGGKKKSSKSSNDAKNKATPELEVTITRLDIRVGLIKKAQKHPDADSLYVEEIDVGEEQPRTVVSGLVKYIPLEEMQNRKVCVLCNLKPATMRGIKSQAMVLAASNSDHTKVELVEPPSSANVGERVTFPGFEGDPDELLNPKKKVWETLQVDLQSNGELVACYKDVPLTTSAGVCKVSSIQNGSIR
ncbi:hypothetical protein PIB30_005376 [Stylosanthes scabra]|uniref:methionine--tRNA ligase n=1 Tax=Stylosanthes scabra TaxID=79078 RepID=A0ABU6W766_9FABA|nr:hypothetical protein [Stylosanthes scabra]